VADRPLSTAKSGIAANRPWARFDVDQHQPCGGENQQIDLVNPSRAISNHYGGLQPTLPP
jgi:hypothetical protein